MNVRGEMMATTAKQADAQGRDPLLRAGEDRTEHPRVVGEGSLPARARPRVGIFGAARYAPLRLRVCRKERGLLLPGVHGA
jgi:hypothetical protein